MLEVVHSFGVSTSRFICGLVHQEIDEHNNEHHLFMGPLGSCFVEWDLKTRRQRRRVQAHEDMVVCLTQNLEPDATTAKQFMACTFAGEVALWDFQWRKISNTIKVGERVGYAEWRDGRILLSTFEDNALVQVSVRPRTPEELQQGGSEQLYKLTLEQVHRGTFPFGVLLHDGAQLVIEQPSAKSGFTLARCNERFEKQHESAVFTGPLDIIAHQGSLLVLGVRGRTVHLVNAETLEVLDTVKIPGHGIMRQIRLRGSRMTCPSENGTFYDYHIENSKARLQGTFQGPKGAIHFLDWLDDHTCVVCNDYQLWAFNPKHHDNEPLISFHALTCCGIDLFPISDDEFDLAAGDFGGQIVRWRAHDPMPVQKAVVSFPIRSMKWLPGGAALVIGDLEGHVHLCAPGMDVDSVWKLKGGITSIDIAQVPEHNIWKFAFGCTSGMTTVTEIHCDTLVLDFQKAKNKSWIAHRAKPGSQDANFGSIGLYAEVWSLTWSPCSKYLATCSEDQTVAIWNIGDRVSGAARREPEQIKSLQGHTAAVTCIKWKNTVMGEVLVSSSDDRTLRVWRTGTWEPLYEFSTRENPFDIAWHTVTYCEVEPNGSRIVCGTSNGYIFCWDVAKTPTAESSSKFLFGRKMHAGSIEGMCWSSYGKSKGASLIATCSSDCTVQVFRINAQ